MTHLRQMMLEELHVVITPRIPQKPIWDFPKHYHTAPDLLGPDQIHQYVAYLLKDRKLDRNRRAARRRIALLLRQDPETPRDGGQLAISQAPHSPRQRRPRPRCSAEEKLLAALRVRVYWRWMKRRRNSFAERVIFRLGGALMTARERASVAAWPCAPARLVRVCLTEACDRFTGHRNNVGRTRVQHRRLQVILRLIGGGVTTGPDQPFRADDLIHNK